jgi:nucleoside-triphosphatase
MKNILLTGRPGIGKTTLIQKIVDEFKGKAGGFYTREIRENHRRTGFEIVTFSGIKGILSSVQIKGPFRVGRYGVNLKDLEEIGVREIEKALDKDDLIVVDEIGKMELFSQKFKTAVTRALESPKPFLGTIMQGRNPFADKVKKRSDVSFVQVNERNRNSLIFEILRQIKQVSL